MQVSGLEVLPGGGLTDSGIQIKQGTKQVSTKLINSIGEAWPWRDPTASVYWLFIFIYSERLTLSDDTSPAAVLRKRLYWHSRRGMWELDLLLIPFLEKRFDTLSEEEQLTYQRLIEEEDQDLFVWLMHREWPEDPDLRHLVQMIVEHAETTDNTAYRTL